MTPPAPREYGLDALRVFAFAVLIFYHSGMGYVSWPYHVKNPETSTALEYIMLACNRWRLPLLFLISGAGVFFSLRRRSFTGFAAERLSRLLLPLVFAMFVVVPPQIYLERLQQGATYSYAAFYPSVFEFVSYPKGSFSWHHLWFVAYILIFSLIGIPAFALIRSAAGQRAIAAVVRLFERFPPAIYLVNVPNLLIGVYLGPRWPTTHNLTSDWANLTGTFLTFLWGFTIASQRDFLDLITRRRREFAILGIATAAAYFGLRAAQIRTGLWGGNLISSYWGMTWIFAMIGYARTYWNRPTPFLAWASESVYPFYIVHQTITVAAVYALAPVNLGVWPKLGLTVAATSTGSVLAVEMIRRIRPLRPLFGLRPLARVEATRTSTAQA